MARTMFALVSALALATPMAAQQVKLAAVDREFVTRAAQDNNYELEAARLARTVSTNDAVKTYADQIITDHTKLGADLKAAVMAADSTFMLPTDLDQAGQSKLDALKSAGARFDAVYRDQMKEGHSAALTLFEDYGACSDANPGIRAVAQDAKAVIRRHKDMADELPKM